MVKKPTTQAEEITPFSVNTGIFLASLSGTGTSAITLSGGNLTATLTGTATGSALTTPGSNVKVYLECQVTFASGTPYIGLANQLFVPNAFFPGGDWNSVGFRLTDGAIYMGNNNQGSSGVTATSGQWLGLAVNFQTQSVQIRNITTSSAWSSAFSFNAQVQPSPNFFAVGLTVNGNASTINVDGTFLGTPPDGTYTRWDKSMTPLAPAGWDPAYCGVDPTSKITLTNSNLTATLASGGLKAIAASTPGDNTTVYFEVTCSGATAAFDNTIGLMNINETVNGNFPGRTGTNSFCYHGDAGEVYLNGAGVQTGTVSFANGDIVGCAVNFPSGTMQIRNVTHSSAWSAQYTFGSAISAPAPTLLCVGGADVGQAYTVNFAGPFTGSPPAGTWNNWHSTGTAPAPPTGLSAVAISSSQINLSWSASSGATSYIVLRGGTSVGTPSSTSFTDSGLTASTSYTYTVQAVSSGGTSSSSSPVSATTLASGSSGTFPLFTQHLPPPTVGTGGTVPFVISPAPVPPSIAGNALIIYTFGSATTPPASAAFPQGTTTYPSPPIVFSNIFTDGVSPTTPPSTTTTPCVTISGNYGPPIGPALPPVVPVSRPFMMATNGNPDDVIEAQTAAGSEPNGNGEVYDDSDEEGADWVEDTSRRTSPPKPRGRPRRK